VFVIGLEILSDVIPVAGFVLCLPLAVAVYSFQGLLVGWYLRASPRAASTSSWSPIRKGALSAFWTGAVLSPLVALITTSILTPVTLGAALVSLPATFMSGLVDLALNLVFTILGAWIAAHFGKASSLGCSCLVLAVMGVVYWILIAVGIAGIILTATHAIPTPSFFN
jgi:hypothetical protein